MLIFGTPIGLCDAYGEEIKVGDRIQKPTDCNKEMHGSWAVYEVKMQGAVPILSYCESEAGQVLPKGYTASCLSDEYDTKMLVFATDSKTLRPESDLCILDSKQSIKIKEL